MKARHAASHHLLISRRQIDLGINRGDTEWRGRVRGKRLHPGLLVLLAAAIGLSPSWSAGAPRRPKEVGRYDLTISGSYEGSGMAIVNSSGVLIRADVTDEDGKSHKLSTQ